MVKLHDLELQAGLRFPPFPLFNHFDIIPLFNIIPLLIEFA